MVTRMPRRPDGQKADPSLLILASLASGPKHGYGMTQDIREFAGVALGPGTLYGAIARLVERGLIEPTGSDDRRRPYQLTDAGREALADQVSVLGRLTATALKRLGAA